MRKVVSIRAATQYLRGPVRYVGTTAGSVGGGVGLVVLSILFWSIFYGNLPDIPGADAIESDSAVPGANLVDRIAKVCMIAMSIYVISTRWSLTRSLAKGINVGAMAMLVLAGLSALWSIDPNATILRYVSLAAIFLNCFAISLAGWHRQRFQQLALPPLMFILVVSLVVGFISPESMMEVGDDLSLKGAWHGITLTKNQFGMAASLGVIICVNRWLALEGRTIWAILGTVIASTCLLLSRSNTSQFATAVAVLSMVLVMRVPLIRRRYSTHVVVAIAATILLYELVVQDVLPGAHTLLAPVRSLTGKDATFSARTMIWDIVKEHIRAAPYLGTGYAAYWVGPVQESPSFVFTYRMFFYPTEAHNGYLDIVNDLGYVGLLCLLVFLISYMRQALQLLRFDRNQAALYLALLFQLMIMNMSESEWLSRDNTFTVFILAITCLSRALREGRLQAHSALSATR